MKKFFNIVLLLLMLLFLGGWTDAQLNFRDTSTFVTDGAGQTYVLNENYTTTRDTIAFGFTDGLGGDRTRDRDAGVDPRFAGGHFTNSTGSQDRVLIFRVDLPATGTYDIRLSLGDHDNSRTNQKAELFDNVTSKFTVTDASTAAGHYVDATGVERTSESDWITNNAKQTVTFASTTLILKIGTTAATSDNTFLTHLRITAVSTGIVRRRGINGGFSGMVGDLK